MLLEISNLEVTVSTNEIAHTVRIPSIAVDQGQMAILMGPSGSGKSVLLKTLSGVFSHTEVDVKGEVTVNEKNGNSIRLCDGVNISETVDRPVVFYVFQDPRSYLHPRLTLREYGTLLEHRLPTVQNVGELFEDSIEKSNLAHSWEVPAGYLSGGEAQRLMFAIMNVLRPRLVLADEPLSAQDRVHHEQLRGMLNDYVANSQNEAAMILVTHEIRDIQRSFELGTKPVFYALEKQSEQSWQCSRVIASESVQQLARSYLENDGDLGVDLTLPEIIVDYFRAGRALYAPKPQEDLKNQVDGEPILSTQGLSFRWVKGRKENPLFSGINLEHRSDSNLGVMGLSGVGKSTLAEVLLGLTHGWDGKINWFNSHQTTEDELRQRVQYVFQDCERAMAWEVGNLEQTILLPFRTKLSDTSTSFQDTFNKVLGTLNLLEHTKKNVQHLSGGQLRRAYLARALLVLLSDIKSDESVLLVLDEATVGLDLVAQYQLLHMLHQYTTDQYQNMSLMVISHDPVVLRYLCNKIAVLFNDNIAGEGAKVVESLEGTQIGQGPFRHEHTRLLMGGLH